MKKREKEKCRRGKRTLGQDWNNNHMRMMGEWRALLAVDAHAYYQTDIMFCILKTASGSGGGRASRNSSHIMYRHFAYFFVTHIAFVSSVQSEKCKQRWGRKEEKEGDMVLWILEHL